MSNEEGVTLQHVKTRIRSGEDTGWNEIVKDQLLSHKTPKMRLTPRKAQLIVAFRHKR